MEQTRNIAVLHHTGGGNLGDDASVHAVIEGIRQRWPDTAFTILSMNPEDSEKKHGVPAYPLRTYTWNLGYRPIKSIGGRGVPARSPKSAIRVAASRAVRAFQRICRAIRFLIVSFGFIRRFNLLVISGGGQLTERGGAWGFPFTIFKWVLLSRLAGVRCICLNVGAGPLRTRLSRLFVKYTLAALQYISFRDVESEQLAREIGFTGASPIVTDSVYGLRLPTLISAPGRRKEAVVGISPMPYPYCDPLPNEQENDAIYKAFIGALARFGSSVAGQSYSLRLFGTDIGVDYSSIGDLHEALTSDYGVKGIQSDPLHTQQELLSAMAEMEYVVTCRFHGVVFAHLLNKPVLAIAHHPKVSHLMRDLGLEQYCLDIKACDSDRLMEIFTRLVRNRDEIKRRMASSLEHNRAQLKIQMDTLFPPAQAGTEYLNRNSVEPLVLKRHSVVVNGNGTVDEGIGRSVGK